MKSDTHLSILLETKDRQIEYLAGELYEARKKVLELEEELKTRSPPLREYLDSLDHS